MLCTIALEIGRVEFDLGQSKRLERESRNYWLKVLNGERLPVSKTRGRLTPSQHFVRKLIDSLIEMDRTLRLMRYLEVYAAAPLKLKGDVTPLDFFGYLIESHLQEVYILRERIDAFSKILERAYRNERGARRIADSARRIRRGAKRALGKLVQVRSAHVHQRRLRVPDLERVEFIRDFGSHATRALKPKFDRAYVQAFRELRDQRLENMRAVNQTCQQLLDFVGANALHCLLRNNLSEFRFPRDLQGRT